MKRTTPIRLATVTIGIARRIQPAIITDSDIILLLVDDTFTNLSSIFPSNIPGSLLNPNTSFASSILSQLAVP